VAPVGLFVGWTYRSLLSPNESVERLVAAPR
jgi:hypothetical protein